MMLRTAVLLVSCAVLGSCSVLNAFGVLTTGPECGEEEFYATVDEGDENYFEVCCEGDESNVGYGDVLQCLGNSCVMVDDELFLVECCGDGDTAGQEIDEDTICCREVNLSTNYAECGDEREPCLYFEGGDVDCCADDEMASRILIRPIAAPLDTYETSLCCRSTGPDLWRCGGLDCTGPDEQIECVE